MAVGAAAGRPQASEPGLPADRHDQHPVHLRRRVRRPREDHPQPLREVRASASAPTVHSKSRRPRDHRTLFREVEPEDLIKFGLIPELVGRLPVVATLGELDRGRAGPDPHRAEERAGQAVPEAVPHGRRRARDPRPRAARRSPARRWRARPARAACARSWSRSLIDTMFELPIARRRRQGRGRRATIAERRESRCSCIAEPAKISGLTHSNARVSQVEQAV